MSILEPMALTEADNLSLAALVEFSEDAIISKTLDCIITGWNPAAERLYAYTAEEMVGQPIARLLPPGYADELPAIMERLRRGERISHFETVRLRKDTTRVNVSLSISPLINDDGIVIGAVTIARDITERKRAEARSLEREQALNQERLGRVEAEASVRMRDMFMAIAAHELRTPLTVIKTTVQLLLRRYERGPVEPARVIRSLESVNTVTDQVNLLVEDMFDVSRLRTGQLQLRLEPTELANLAQVTVDEQHARLDRQHTITLTVFGLLPPLRVDPVRMHQVLSNLVENAIKYSPTGGEVHISLREQDLGVWVAVSDRGIGLPPGAATSIFEPFGRASNAQKSQVRGMGLGLYITRQIVEQHGGRIWADSAGENLGTQLNFWLPGIEVHDTRQRRRRVLVVDDEPTIRTALGDLFEVEGFDCRVAADGREALTVLADWGPDLIVLDLMMPVMDGWAFRRAQQATSAGRDIPVVVISARPTHDQRNAELTAAAFLPKPLEMGELVSTVQQMLGQTAM